MATPTCLQDVASPNGPTPAPCFSSAWMMPGHFVFAFPGAVSSPRPHVVPVLRSRGFSSFPNKEVISRSEMAINGAKQFQDNFLRYRHDWIRSSMHFKLSIFFRTIFFVHATAFRNRVGKFHVSKFHRLDPWAQKNGAKTVGESSKRGRQHHEVAPSQQPGP